MTVATVMLTDPRTARAEDTVPQALELMLRHGIRNLPVVDDQGRFLGTFSTVHLIRLLLPTVATLEPGFYQGLPDLTFVHQGLEDIRDRLQEVRSHRVGDYMDTENVPTVSPRTSVIEAMLLLYRHRTHVPVVAEPGHRLVGVVTLSRILEAILKV